jgi:hypothetical protein
VAHRRDERSKQKRTGALLRTCFFFVGLVGRYYNSDEIGNSIYDSSRITVFSAVFAVVCVENKPFCLV